MVLPVAGTITLSMIEAEFKRAAPTKLTDYYGAAVGLPSVGEITLNDFRGKAFKVVREVTANTTDLVISSLFTPEEWAADSPKEVTIAEGVIVGATSIAVAALRTGTARGGTLKLIIDGEIQGKGGAANSGAGGPALNVQQVGLTIENNGAIRAGGGGGGKAGNGGTGGQGTYTVSEGPAYTLNTTDWVVNGNINSQGRWSYVSTTIRWGGSTIVNGSISGLQNATSYTSGSVTYYRQTLVSGTPGSSTTVRYQVSRTYPAYTSGGGGGTGGNGAAGRGYNTAKGVGSNGTAGSAGGTNAGSGGSGGKGGDGGDWGAAGAAGAPGAIGNSGNYTGGSAGTNGTAGGPAGAAIIGVARTITGEGVINGSTA